MQILVSCRARFVAVASVLLLGAATVQPAQAQSGPVAAYAFEATSGTTAVDASGNNLTGTVSGATWTTAGRFGSALTFNGTNAWVTVPDHALLDLTTGMTLQAWVYPTALSGYRTVIMKERPGELAYTLYAHDGAPRPSVWITAGTSDTATGTAALPLNTWTHLATTYDGATLRLYVNGVQVGSKAHTGALFASGDPLRIGGNAVWGEYFQGRIDEVRVYARALSAAEIQADMATPVIPPAPDTTAPVVALTSPAPNATVSGTITLSATASDNIGVAGVQFLIDGVPAGAEDTTTPYSVSFNTGTLTNTTHLVTARARDAAGNTTTSTPAVTITASNPPQLVITAPLPNSTVTSTTVPITYTTIGDLTNVNHVHFQLDGGAEIMDLSFDGVFQLTNVAAGPHVLSGFLVLASHTKIPGTDAVPVSFTTSLPDTTAPLVQITAPAGGATVSGTLQVTATASDNVAVTGVQFQLDGVNLGAEDLTAPYTVSWNTATASAGPHTLTAIARDAANNQTTSLAVAVVVSNPFPAGLVAAYAFEATTGTTAVDASGNNLTGTVSGATWTTAGRFGSALTFNGTNAWVTVPDHALLDLTTGMTLQAWVYPTALSGYRTVIMKERPGELAYTLYAHDGAPRPSVWITAGTSDTATGTAALPLNTWTHLATTYDGATLRLYVNGVQVGSKAHTGALFTSGDPLRIGGNAVWGEYFQGRIDEVRVYARALSAAEIQTDMATPVIPPAPDTTAPVVALTSPAPNATVSGTITLSATASDNIGVAGVQFLIDGVPAGAEDTTTPYSVSFNTGTLTNTTHLVTARARDAAGNTTTSTPAVTITASNPPQLVITAPLPNSTVTSTTVPITYTTIGDLTNVNHVHFQLDGGAEIMDLSFDGVFQLTNVAAGPHVLSGFLVLASHTKIPGTDAVPVSFTTSLPDTTAPLVQITAPAGGATVSGTLQVTATASDNVAVTGVQFQLDGVNLGAEDLTAPYAVSWNTATAASGAHSLTAIARDAANNRATSTAVGVNVLNGNDPAVAGSWAAPFELGNVAVNMVLLHTGSVLFYTGEYATTGVERLWNPTTGAFTNVPLGGTNLFCSGHSQMADGRILVIGGHDPANGLLGSRDVNIFDPVSRTWTSAAKMTDARWYPSATTLPDGRVLAMSGGTTCLTCIADIPEVYNPRTNTWSRLTAARLSVPYYPFTFVLPDGRVLNAGANENAVATRTLNVATQTWTMIDPIVVDGHSAAMYRPGQIIKSGTATDSGGTGTSAGTAYVIDMNQPSPTWRQVASMAFPRAFHNTVTLPTGDVLVTGGGRRKDGYDGSFAVKEAELWSPATETWRTLAAMQLPRLYHSTALLLPDGRVLVAGGGNDSTAVNYTQGEIFSPPYLFQGPRPTITAAPSLAQYASSFAVDTPDAATITSVSLIRPGAVTHSFDEDQRFLNLSFTQQAGRLTIQAPQNANLAPPGYYMLFIMRGQVPSTAAFIRLPSPDEDTEPPTAPTGLAAEGGIGSVTLTWNAATDNTGVAAYNIHRATTPNVVPSAANRIGRTGATGFVDAAPGGVYSYVVTAEDINGNLSPASNEAVGVVLQDTVFPTVAVSNPTDGSVVSNVVQVSANASDNVAVVGVRFELDGAPLGSEDLTAPFSYSWPTSVTANGVHAVTAVARDAAGNQTRSVTINVTVLNTQGPTGLVVAFNFDQGSGNVVPDASGSGNPGQISSAVWSTSGRYGGALQFNGTSSMVNVNDAANLDLTTGMTLEAWVNPSQLSGWRTAIMKERPGEIAYALYAHDGAPRPSAWITAGSPTTAAGTAALPLNTWTHLATTYDGAVLRLYVNGVQVASTTRAGSLFVSADPLRIGGNAVWGEYFSGLIDEVRVYNRALSTAEIQTDMGTPIGGN